MSEPKNLHACSAPKDAKGWGYGAALDCCVEDEDGRFLVHNGEYGSFVNFCPFCGEKAPKGIPLK